MGIHGGDIYRNEVKLDFSVNVNPLGMPESVAAALHGAVERCGSYPDIKAEKLKKAVSESVGIPEEYLLFGNGVSELFMAVMHGIKPEKTVIPVPSFYGYEYAAKAAGGEIIYYVMKQENSFCPGADIDAVLTKDVQLLFLANPNNPVGNLLGRKTLLCLLQHCQEKGIYVVLDESFIEFCGERFSMLAEIEALDCLILIRTFTKIFSIPGVRLGYLICSNPKIRNKIATQLPEWNLSGFAQEAGCVCAGQREFIRETENYIKTERQLLEEGLKKKGFRVFPSCANFIMFYSDEDLYEKLLEKGILIRDCRNFRGLGQGFYRIAVKTRKENEILLDAIGHTRGGY